jgi:hypothetical protein
VFISSFAIMMVPFHTYKLAQMPSGKTEGLYAAGFCSLSALIVIHHAHIFMFIRNWTYLMVLICAVSVLWFMPIGIGR